MPYTFPDDIEEEIFINICGRRSSEYIVMKDGLVYKNENMPGTNTHYAEVPGNHICHKDQLTYVYTLNGGMAGEFRVMMLQEFMKAFPKYVKELQEKGKTHLYSPHYITSFGVHHKEKWTKKNPPIPFY